MSASVRRRRKPGRSQSAIGISAACAIAVGILIAPPASAGQSNATVADLKVNANPEPLGIDDPTPTMTWEIASADRGVMQKGYRLVVSTTAEKAAAGKGDVWDSGRVSSDATSVDYAGPALAPRTRYYWSVQARTPRETSWSAPGYFETAYLNPSQWKGQWISGESRPTAAVAATDGVADDNCCLQGNSTLNEGTRTGDTRFRLKDVTGFKVGDQVTVGSGDGSEQATVATVGTSGASTTVVGDVPAGTGTVHVASAAGFAVGTPLVIGTAPASVTANVTRVGTAAAATTTLLIDAPAGATKISYVAPRSSFNSPAPTLFFAGDPVSVGNKTYTVATVGAGGGSAVTSADAAVGATSLAIGSPTATPSAGDKAVIGGDEYTVVEVTRDTGFTLKISSPLTKAVASGSTLVFPGAGVTLTAPLSDTVAAGATVQDLGTGVDISPVATNTIAPGTAVSTSGSGLTLKSGLTKAHSVGDGVVGPAAVDVCRPVGDSKNAGSCKPIRPNYLLRKSFDVAPVSEHGAVVSARLYSTGLGWNEPSVNGQLTQPGGHLNPGFTDYKDTVQYTTDDVTGLIKQDARSVTTNVVASEIAAGRYDSESVPSNHRFESAQWRNQETLRADLYVRYADGTEQLVKSDNSWLASTGGPTRYADFDDGEIYDARKKIDGWNTAGFDTGAWQNAGVIQGPAGTVVAMEQEQTKVVNEVKGPFPSYTTAAGAQVFDTKRQYTGWATIKVWGAQPGQVIRVVFVERRNDNKTIDDPSVPGTGQDGDLQFAGNLQQDYYVSNGTGTEQNPEIFAPNWNFAGFQWVQIDGSNGTKLPDSVHVDVASVQQVRTAQPEVGTFDTSVPLLNQIYANVKSSVQGDWIAGYSMDTPTYEKDGWTGDAQIILPTVANIYDIQRSMQKSSQDSVDSQLANGQVGLLIPGSEGYGYCSPTSPSAPNVYTPCGNSPSLNVFKSNGGGSTPIWDAFLMVTWAEAYLRYADLRPIETAYVAMTKYMDTNLQGGKPYSEGPGGWFLADGNLQNGQPDWTLTSGLGDWAFVTGAEGNAAEGTNLNVGGMQAASSTAFTAYLATKTAEAAKLLYAKTKNAKYLNDAKKYEDLFQKIRKDFNSRWWDAGRGFYAENSTQELRQGFQAWAIGFGLVEDQNKRALEEKLAYDVAVTRTGHAMVGFVGIRWIWPVLSQAAHDGVPYAKEALFKVAQQTTYPSYGYQVGLGYTGVGEYWESTTRTRNHQFQGSIGQWFYEELAGIKPASAGYKDIQIRPLVGNEYGVNQVSATYDSIHGKIASSWQVDDDGTLTLKVTIPANTRADVYVPGTDPNAVVENGTGKEFQAGSAPGVTKTSAASDATVYSVGSGDYSFVVRKTLTNTALPTVSGKAQVGETLTATDGSWSAQPTGFGYQWQRDGSAIDQATGQQYVLTAADQGHRIAVRVTPVLAGYTASAADSDATRKVLAGRFVNNAAPVISGTTKVGSTLSVTAGDWTPKPTTVTYQWLRDGTAIPRANGTTYKLTAKDRGTKISVLVSVQAPGYSCAYKITDKTGRIS